MSIKDLDKQVALAKMYADLKQAQLYAKQWAATVNALSAQLSADPIYLQNVSAEEFQFVADSALVSDTFTKGLPAAPDVVSNAAVVSDILNPVKP